MSNSGGRAGVVGAPMPKPMPHIDIAVISLSGAPNSNDADCGSHQDGRIYGNRFGGKSEHNLSQYEQNENDEDIDMGKLEIQ